MASRALLSANNNPPVMSKQCLTAFRIVGDVTTLGIVHVLSSGAKRFSELQRLTHVNPATLTGRLKHMQGLNLVQRREQEVDNQSVSYSLTRTGNKLIPILEQIEAFANQLPPTITINTRK